MGEVTSLLRQFGGGREPLLDPATTQQQIPDRVPDTVVAPVTCQLRRWLVSPGTTVSEGDQVAVIEAMKMESPVLTPAAGTLSLEVEAGSPVESQQVVGHLG